MKNRAIVIAVIASCALYIAGLISGLAVSKELEAKQEEDFSFLVDYVSSLDNQLRSYQIQDAFVNSLPEKDRCVFADIHFRQVANELNYYWTIFPSRLEEYERDKVLSPEYKKLKEQYTKLSLRAWLVSRKNYNECNSNIIPVLYFYSRECDICVEQGEMLDLVKLQASKQGKNVIVFTLDYFEDEPSLELIKKYYVVMSVPAMIINEKTIQGRLFSNEEIFEELR